MGWWDIGIHIGGGGIGGMKVLQAFRQKVVGFKPLQDLEQHSAILLQHPILGQVDCGNSV